MTPGAAPIVAIAAAIIAYPLGEDVNWAVGTAIRARRSLLSLGSRTPPGRRGGAGCGTTGRPQEAAGGAGGTGGSDTTGTTTATGGPNELVALAAVHRVGPKRPLGV
jgi:hypothetical protein